MDKYESGPYYGSILTLALFGERERVLIKLLGFNRGGGGMAWHDGYLTPMGLPCIT